tara:strand:- start:160 stop:468 length:309 start_codon:yes stop_codon:yes gene_type:complete
LKSSANIDEDISNTSIISTISTLLSLIIFDSLGLAKPRITSKNIKIFKKTKILFLNVALDLIFDGIKSILEYLTTASKLSILINLKIKIIIIGINNKKKEGY